LDTNFINIVNRRSVRRYKDDAVPDEIVDKILTAASYAPSGKNGQPWRFIVIRKKKIIQQLAELTVQSRFIATAPCIIAVLLDNSKSYSKQKDVMAIGAAIQNILLTTQESEFSSCWIGEILNRENEVKLLLEIALNYSLMAVITIGKSVFEQDLIAIPKRKDLSELIIKSI